MAVPDPQGWKEYGVNAVVTNAEYMGYSIQQVITVFADATARDAAITEPKEGQHAFLKDSDTLTYYDGAAWVDAIPAVSLAALLGDVRDNRALLGLLDGPPGNTNVTASNAEGLGIGLTSRFGSSASITTDAFRGGMININTLTGSGAFAVCQTTNAVAYGDRNPYFAAILTSQAANAALAAQIWGFVANTVPSNNVATTTVNAMFRSITTGNLFAVTGNTSNAETTDLGAHHTLGQAGLFEVFAEDDGATWKFKIDGVLVATHTTQVPAATTGMLAAVGIENNTTTALSVTNVDLIYATQDRS